MELKLKKSTTNVYIISIIGELDLYHTHQLKDLIERMIAKNVDKIVFDLEETDYMDSSGLGVFIYFFSKEKKEHLAKFCMCNVGGSALRLINLSKLNNYFTISKDINSAVALLEN